MSNFLNHLKVIHNHRKLVRKGCFKVGLYFQGLTHDLSKYSPAEFWVGVKYFQGDRSPNNAEREDIGYSSSWIHHKGRNKHHFEYWIDYSAISGSAMMVPVPMPDKYIVEMAMDRIAASKIYKGNEYNDSCPLEYLNKGKSEKTIHPDTLVKLEKMLTILANEGEEQFFKYVKEDFLNK